MSPATRATVLFWCQVGLYVAAMVTLLGILALFWHVMTTQMHTLSQNQERDKAMLQQHTEAMQDHARAREQHTLAFRAMMERLSR